MSKIDELARYFSEGASLVRLSMNELNVLRNKFPGIPEDYLRFMELAGYGDIGSIQIYSGLVPASEIYPSQSDTLFEIRLFGDDFQGYCFGFDIKKNWNVVEVSPRGEISYSGVTDFIELLNRFR